MSNPWLIHLKGVRSDNPTLSYKQCMQKGKLSYKKQRGKGIVGDSVGALWRGIKALGKGAAIASIGIPVVMLRSELALISYLKSQPDGGTAMIKQAFEFLANH